MSLNGHPRRPAFACPAIARTIAAFASLGLAAFLLPAGAARAFPDAQIDAQIRPSFGALLHPRLRRFHYDRPVRRFDRWEYEQGGRYVPIGRDYGDYHGPWSDRRWRFEHGFPAQGPIQTITVDCGDSSLGPTPLSDALYFLADGGTLYIKAGGHPCAETLIVTRPVTIAGEPPPAFAPNPVEGPPVIAPSAGAPCIQVMPGAGTVELRDLTLSAQQAGGQACIQSWDSDLALVRTRLRYVGDASAVYVSGGHLLMRDSEVGSGGYDPAIAAEGAGLVLDNVDVTAAATGLDVAPGGEPVTLDHVTIESAPGVDPALSPETGLTVRYARGGSAALSISDARIDGFRTGLWLDQGARADVSRLQVVGSKLAVVSRATDLSLAGSELNAEDTGVYVVMGHARIIHNTVYGFEGSPIAVDRGAEVVADDNWIYPVHECRDYREFRRTCRAYGERPDRFRDHDHDHDGPPLADVRGAPPPGFRDSPSFETRRP